MEKNLHSIAHRKDDHLEINLNEEVESSITTGFDRLYFMNEALPEIDFTVISTTCSFLNKSLKLPILVSSMTGGNEAGDIINARIAEAVQETGIAMGVGSQRIALENRNSGNYARLRTIAPEGLIFANLGAVQLNYGFSVDDCKKAIDFLQADGLILHLNPLQEVLQPEGQTNFSGLLKKIELVCRSVKTPVIVKEVGWGISGGTAKKLVEAGVSAIDVAGAGGTSWSQVEKFRNTDETRIRICEHFRNWGIPTADAIKMVHNAVPGSLLIASGGLKTGIDLAKTIALGANLGGFAGALIKTASHSTDALVRKIEEIGLELKITMFAAGSGNIKELANLTLHEHPGNC